MNPEQALEKFGLETREAAIYLKLLELGQSTANNISKSTRILRQTVYEILDKLIEKGLVSHSIKGGVKYFEAADPSKFKSILSEKQKIIDSVLPQLGAIQKLTVTKPKIEVYEGIEGLKSIYNDIIKSKPKELLEYGNSQSFIEIMKFYFIENYIKRRVERKIRLRLLTEKNEITKEHYATDKKSLRETKYLLDIHEISTAGYIYGNKVAMLSLVENPVGVIIENTEFADTQRVFFELLWKNASRN